MDDLLYRLRATGIPLCDEAADRIEAQARVIAQWSLGSAVVAERVIGPLMDRIDGTAGSAGDNSK